MAIRSGPLPWTPRSPEEVGFSCLLRRDLCGAPCWAGRGAEGGAGTQVRPTAGPCRGLRQGCGTLGSWDARWHRALRLAGVHRGPADLRSSFGSQSRRPGSAYTDQCCWDGTRRSRLRSCQIPNCDLSGIQFSPDVRKEDDRSWFVERGLRRETRAGTDLCTRAQPHFGAARIRPDLPPVVHPSGNYYNNDQRKPRGPSLNL